MKTLWRDYSLSIVLAGLFVVSWGLQTWAGWHRFAAEQEAHQEVAEVFGASGYVWEWLSATMENWQSEFLQLLTFVVLTASLIHRGSHESKDSDDEMKGMLQRIEQRLGSLDDSRRSPRVVSTAGGGADGAG
ncbi:MAG TPA: DUF6766 family protein [Methylomirabilota bacterium]|nr:DUF6766 family protein [Methylomirabilota bacterium]